MEEELDEEEEIARYLIMIIIRRRIRIEGS